MHLIMESLSVGNVTDAQKPPPFISAVLWAALDPKISPPHGVLFARIPLREFTEADPIDIEAGVDWLSRYYPANSILIACRAGMGRSVSVVIAYLCCIKGMSFEEARQFVLDRHAGATPLPNLEQTIEKVKELRRRKTHRKSMEPQRAPHS